MTWIKTCYNRTQTYLFPVSLDQSIDPDNEVRLIDLFADSLSLQEFGFKTDFVDNGRPAYHPADLLKLCLEVLILSISGIYRPIRFKLNPFKAINFLNKILTTFFERLLNRLIFGHYLLEPELFRQTDVMPNFQYKEILTAFIICRSLVGH